MGSLARKKLEEWARKIPVRGRVLDVGGAQNDLKHRVFSWHVKDYVCMDLEQPHESKHHVDYIQDIQKDLNTSQFDYYEGYFDQVFVLEVSEYWHDPMKALKNINRLMTDFGELYISFHTLYGLHPPAGEDCLRYTKNAIVKMMKGAGFKIEDIVEKRLTGEGEHHLLNFYKSQGMRCSWGDSQLLCEGYLIKAIKE